MEKLFLKDMVVQCLAVVDHLVPDWLGEGMIVKCEQQGKHGVDL